MCTLSKEQAEKAANHQDNHINNNQLNKNQKVNNATLCRNMRFAEHPNESLAVNKVVNLAALAM